VDQRNGKWTGKKPEESPAPGNIIIESKGHGATTYIKDGDTGKPIHIVKSMDIHIDAGEPVKATLVTYHPSLDLQIPKDAVSVREVFGDEDNTRIPVDVLDHHLDTKKLMKIKTHPEDFVDMVKDGGELMHLSLCIEDGEYFMRPVYQIPPSAPDEEPVEDSNEPAEAPE